MISLPKTCARLRFASGVHLSGLCVMRAEPCREECMLQCHCSHRERHAESGTGALLCWSRWRAPPWYSHTHCTHPLQQPNRCTGGPFSLRGELVLGPCTCRTPGCMQAALLNGTASINYGCGAGVHLRDCGEAGIQQSRTVVPSPGTGGEPLLLIYGRKPAAAGRVCRHHRG